jgi:hypothetical protein
MARKRKENDIPGEVGRREEEFHGRWVRNSGAPRKVGAPPGNINGIRHGIFANKFLAEDEKPLFESIIAQLYLDFVFNKSSDFMQVELVAIYFLKLGRAQEAGDWETAERLDRMIRCHLKDLKATKIAREGEQPKGPETTPAEWAAELVARLKQASGEAPAAPAGKNAQTTSDNTAHAEDEDGENAGESEDGEEGEVE